MGLPHNDIQELTLVESQPLTADFSTPAQEIRYFDMGSVQAIWVGANANNGRIIPEVSLDGINWCQLITEAEAKKVTAGDGCSLYSYENLSQAWFRVRFKKNSNTMGVVKIITLFKRRKHVL